MKSFGNKRTKKIRKRVYPIKHKPITISYDNPDERKLGKLITGSGGHNIMEIFSLHLDEYNERLRESINNRR